LRYELNVLAITNSSIISYLQKSFSCSYILISKMATRESY